MSNRRLRPILLVLVSGLIIMEIVALSPTSLEEIAPRPVTIIDEASLAAQEDKTLATGIPKGRIPEYSVEQFHYVSTANGEKQWSLLADKALMFNKEKLVHARAVHALLYDSDGKTTLVSGKEAKYFMNQKDLEVFGDVVTVFPDGFQLTSQYLRYHPGEHLVDIPATEAVHGEGTESDDKKIRFDSHGLHFAMAKSQINLEENVHFTLEQKRDPESPSGEPTKIDADHCVIHRDRSLALFTMKTGKDRYVEITQPTLLAKGRQAKLNYGDYSQLFNYLTVEQDVFIKELPTTEPTPSPRPSSSLRYATGGRADFDTHRDVIILKEYPQVYQSNDTITGDTILLHRDTDVIEVEHSNAFSDGNSEK